MRVFKDCQAHGRLFILRNKVLGDRDLSHQPSELIVSDSQLNFSCTPSYFVQHIYIIREVLMIRTQIW